MSVLTIRWVAEGFRHVENILKVVRRGGWKAALFPIAFTRSFGDPCSPYEVFVFEINRMFFNYFIM